MQALPRRALPAPKVAAIYAAFALLALALNATIMPPFQNADEPAHTYRADQISHGEIRGRNLTPFTAGGKVDSGLPEAASRFATIPFHGENKISRSMYAPVAWGQRVKQEFSNTSVYPPFFYLPAAAALMIARGLHANVFDGLTAARLATGLVSIAVGTLAIAQAEGAAIWLFTILLLPMSCCVTAAVSQDAPMIATTALAAVLCRRAAGSAAPPRILAAISALLALVGMARPPYAVFALLPLAARAPIRQRLLASLFIIVSTAIWVLLNLHRVHYTMAAPGAIDPARQLHYLIAAPDRIPALLAQTWNHFADGIFEEFIGVPGWLDVFLPRTYLHLAYGVLMLALAASVASSRLRARATIIVSVSMLGACAAIALSQYMAASLIGHSEITGMQGRYFLPPALLIAALPPGGSAYDQWLAPVQRALLLFPIISISVTINAIVARYYY